MRAGPTLLRIGTRGSALALWQTDRIRAMLESAGYPSERIEIKTTGDLAPETPLSRLGDRALFTRQIDDALLAGRIDVAVHSLKDLPTVLPSGIGIAAIGEREDPRDALIGRDRARWADLPPRAVIGTSSLRRRAQLLHLRPNSRVVDLRGNVDTRLAKLNAHAEWDAIILATAGLVRLGLEHRIGERLPPETLLPAPGQGALAVTVRSDDSTVFHAVREAVHHPTTARVVAAERGFLRRLEGGCQLPVAALAEIVENGQTSTIRLHGRVISVDGETMIEGHEDGHTADEEMSAALGAALAERLLREGAGSILAGVTHQPAVTEP